MDYSPEKILWQKQISKGLLIKIVGHSLLEDQEKYGLVIMRQGTSLFPNNIAHIKIKEGNENFIKMTAKQLIQLLAHEETEIQIRDAKQILVRNHKRRIWIELASRGQHQEKKDEEKTSLIEERLVKLEEIFAQQQKKFEEFTLKTESVIKKQEQKIECLTSQLEESKEQLSKAKISLSAQNRELLSLKQTILPLVIQQQQFSCFHHPYNPHSHHFTLRLNSNRLKITKTSDNTFHNFISNLPIHKSKITSFRIRQVKVVNGQVYIGVGTRSVFGDINSWNRDFLSYYSGDGDICENGLYHQGGEQIRDGQIVTVRVDLIEQRVSWWLQNKKLAEAFLPEQMLDKHLYLVLLMKHKGDELDLLLDQSMI